MEKFEIEKCENMAQLFEDVAKLHTPVCDNCVKEYIIVSPKKKDSNPTETIIFSPPETIVSSLSCDPKHTVNAPVNASLTYLHQYLVQK